MRWAGNAARLDHMRNVYMILVGKLDGKGHMGNRVMTVKMILRWIFKRIGYGLDSTDSG